MTLTSTAENLLDFMARIKEIETKWKDSDDQFGLWFRGLQKADWALVPKLYRELEEDEDSEEDDIREYFVTRAPTLTTYKPENEWEWYFLMQHYGAPTRLLD